MEAKDYYIYRYINQKISKVGIPYDEAVAMIVPFLLFFILGHYLIGIITAFLGFIGIKRLKKGEGSAYLKVLAYWYAPVCKIPGLQEIYYLRKTPAAEKRHWI